MKKLFLSSLFANIIVMVLFFVTGVLSARYLGPVGKGELAVVTRWPGLFSIVFSFGLPGALVFLGKLHGDKRRNYLGAYIVVGTCLGVGAMGVAYAAMPLLFHSQSDSLITLYKFALITILLNILADGPIGMLQVHSSFKKLMFMRVLSPLGNLAIIVLLIAFGSYTVSSFMYSSTAWSLAMIVVSFILIRKLSTPALFNVGKTSAELLRQGRSTFFPNLATNLGGTLDQVVISLFLSANILGYYTVAISIGGIVPSFLIGAINLFLWPKLMDLRPEERNEKVEQFHRFLFYATLIIAVLMMLVTPILLPLLYGSQYRDAILMSEILVLCIPFKIGYAVFVNYFSSQGAFRNITIVEIIGLCSGVAATIILVNSVGGIGAAIGSLVHILVKWTLGLKYGRKHELRLRHMLKFSANEFLGMFRNARKLGIGRGAR